MLMGLINLCLLSLVSAQEPNTNATAAHTAVPSPPAATAPATTAQGQDPVKQANRAAKNSGAQIPGEQDPGGDQDPRKILAAAEAAGDAADANVLAELAMAAHADVAARAAWLLGNNKNPAHQAQLAAIAANSPHPEARLQALQAIRISADVTSTQLAIETLADTDRRVRTVAVQLLGKLRRPTSIEPLLELLGTSSKLESDESATDVQAALLTLADLDASEHLLRMSSAINDGKAAGNGEALTYAFQMLSPKLDGKAETTVLVAVLAHKEPMLRRYAITRLTELDSKSALTALEGRLGSEGNELRPLIEVAIAQIRHDGKAPPKDNVELATSNAKALWARTATRWHSLVPTQQALVGATPIVLILLLWMVRRVARRRARDEDAINAAAMVQPSDEYLDEHAEEYDDEYGEYEDEDYDEDDAEFNEDAFDDDEEADDQPEYDTTGWDEDGEETVPADATPEDELFR
ncbi:MAG: HEAT repeat protein [Planctomycetota bacterium]|jgi:HEAT repeat protein